MRHLQFDLERGDGILGVDGNPLRVVARDGISVKGKIVIARYGHSWRGIKPVVAYEHGAIGCIIYSDPHDDGPLRR